VKSDKGDVVKVRIADNARIAAMGESQRR